MEKNLNQAESIAIIQEMINKAKNQYSESGTLYLVWGFTILVCSLVQFIADYFFNYKQAFYVWLATWLVFIYQIFYLRRKKKASIVNTYTDDILKYVWICFVVCMFIMVFVLIHHKGFTLIHTTILVLYGIPAFLSGAILKVKSLTIGGICCWALAALSLFVPAQYHVLFISLAVVVAWIIPGLYLRKKFLQQKTF